MVWTVIFSLSAIVVLFVSCVSWEEPGPPPSIWYPPRPVRQALFVIGTLLALGTLFSAMVGI